MPTIWGQRDSRSDRLPRRAPTIRMLLFRLPGGAMAEKLDPFDVSALERSLNDSATRVSTIWVSFLIFSLYLLTAATTVTHRQLFLDEPVRGTTTLIAASNR